VDGEILTACQQACPSLAIVFGDLNDPKAKLVEQRSSKRSYALLGELNNRPRLEYLSRVTNPHSNLDDGGGGGGHDGEHGGGGHDDQEHG
jgi:molybdopterin-containing oxidoreductase family iron-sulfur binding subunit